MLAPTQSRVCQILLWRVLRLSLYKRHTALSPHSVATIRAGYETLQTTKSIEQLYHNIQYFKTQIAKYKIQGFIPSDSAIQAIVVAGNERVKALAEVLQAQDIGVLPILAPTVPAGQERLRICLHSFNTEQEINILISQLASLSII